MVLGETVLQHRFLQPPSIVVREADVILLVVETGVIVGIHLSQENQVILAFFGGILLQFLVAESQ